MMVGATVGSSVGGSVGGCVGGVVGISVGFTVGAAVGAVVGAAVGSGSPAQAQRNTVNMSIKSTVFLIIIPFLTQQNNGNYSDSPSVQSVAMLLIIIPSSASYPQVGHTKFPISSSIKI